MVPVHDVVRVGEVGRVRRRQEDGAVRGAPRLLAVEVGGEVLLVVGRVHDGVVHRGAGDVDPAHGVGVDGQKAVPVNREVGERRALEVLGRREHLLGHGVVGVLALPVAVADGAERHERDGEHHERNPEHDAPRAALPRAAAALALSLIHIFFERFDGREAA